MATAEGCTDHPGEATTGACARCGRFTCAKCPKGAGSNEPSRCAACAWRDSITSGALQINGWLLVPAILLLYKVVGCSTGTAMLSGFGRNRPSSAALVAVANLVAAVVFFRRRRIAPAAVIVTFVVEAILVAPSLATDFPPTGAGLVRWLPVLQLVVGAPYFLLSTRVKRTFVLPGL
jgi:Protein of unknown function (DUF2569)